jgi:hypothetical protein
MALAQTQMRQGRFKRFWCRKMSLPGAIIRYNTARAGTGSNKMPDVTIVFWRDIPAQVIVGKGRSGSKVQLAERFEQAIDRCAMKIGAKDADLYLAEWRKAPPYPVEGDPAEVASAEAARLEAEYDKDRIRQLIDNSGWA